MNAVAAPIAVDPAILKRLNCPLEEIAKLCREYQVIELSVFGSVVRDDFDQKKSDIYFLVDFRADATLDLIGYFDLENKLSSLVKRNVDLVSKQSMRPHWRDEIVPNAKMIYAD